MTVRKLATQVTKLRRQAEGQMRKRRGASTGFKVHVDYYALCDLILYFDETREAARQTIRARDALRQVFFSSSDNVCD